MKVLVTGAAGFIGYHVAKRLIERGDEVVGFDSVNDYYDLRIKEARLGLLANASRNAKSGYGFIRANLADLSAVETCFHQNRFDRVIYLAAQAGVRFSLENPHAYVESNIVAFTNILEACRHAGVSHFTYASTSSVYGANTSLPFSEHAPADHPLQFYAATKRANELMAHAYSHLFRLPTTGLRFFTVYGPWGRPDMALFKFAECILAGRPIQLFNDGNHTRDFTYIDDIVDGVIRASDRPATSNPDWDARDPDPATSGAPWRIYNIGNSSRVSLTRYVELLELALSRKAIVEYLPLQPGDAPDTHADVSNIARQVGYRPRTSVEEGVSLFADWFKEYMGVVR